MFFELVGLALSNLTRARARLAMTAAGVLVGTSAVMILVALTIGLQQAAEAGIGSNAALTQIEVYPNWSPDPAESVPQLTTEAVRSFWQIPGVSVVVPTVYLYGELLSGDYMGGAQIQGIDPALLPYLDITVSRGELALGPGEVLVGAHVGESFFDPDAEEWQPITVDLFETPFKVQLYRYTAEVPDERKIRPTVRGQLTEDNYFDYSVLMSLDEVLKLREWADDQEIDPETFRYDQITVQATSRETVSGVSEAIRDLGYMTGGIGDYLKQLNSFFGAMRLVLGGVGGIALLVSAFGVANTMMMAILERTKEIGLMKAIGATDRDVLTIFLVEAGLVGFAGGVAGAGISYLLQNLINRAIQRIPAGEGGVMFLPIDPTQLGGKLVVIPPELALFAVVLAALVGIGAGLYPALRAAKLPPVVALKEE
jgi:putative ABC transport system permease protein